MKKSVGLFLLTGFFMSACGPTKNNPLKDYKDLDLTTKAQNSDPKVKEVPVIQQVPVVQLEYVEVEKKVPVIEYKYLNPNVEQTIIQGNVFQVIYDEKQVQLIEGQENTLNLSIKFLKGKANLKAEITDLPSDAQVTEVKNETNLIQYQIKLTPKIKGLDYEADGSFKVTLKEALFLESDSKKKEDLEKIFKAINKDRTVSYTVRRTKERPTLEIKDFSQNFKMNEEKSFSVIVTAPGTSEGNEPQLVESYDEINAMTKNGFETNGGFYIHRSLEKPKFLGNNKWQFDYKFNSTNKPLLQQFDTNMKLIENPDQLLLRISFFAFTSFGTSSEKKLVHFKMDLNPKKVSKGFDGEKI